MPQYDVNALVESSAGRPANGNAGCRMELPVAGRDAGLA